MVYSPKMIDHCENPRNVGSLNAEDKNVGTGMVGSPACGDMLKLQIKVSEDGIIEDAKFKTFGCGGAVAASSLTTEKVIGMSLEGALSIKNQDIVDELDLPKAKVHCSVLAEEAIKAAVENYREKQ